MIRSRSYFTRSATFNAVFNYTFGRGKRPHQGPFNETTQNVLGYWSLSRSLNPLYKDGTALIRRGSDNETTIVQVNQETGIADPAQVRSFNGWNLTPNSSAVDRWTGRGTSPPTVALNQTHLGEQCAAITFLAGTISGYATSRADRNQSGGTFTLPATGTFIMSFDISISRPLTGSESFFVYYVGAGAGDPYLITQASSSSLVGNWIRVTTPAKVSTAAGSHFPAIFPNANVSGSDVTIYIKNIQVEAGTSATTYEPRTTTAAGDSFLVTLYEQAENGRNLLRFSEEFDNAAWANSIAGTGVAPTVTPNAGVSPFGDLVADRIQFSLGGGTTTSDYSRRVQSTGTGVNTYTYSIYLRSFDGISTYNMHLVDPFSQTRNIVVTGSWQRFEVSATPTVNPTIGLGLRGGQSLAHPNTADVLVWGAQLEVGTTATTYERRTTHGAGTRLNFTQSTTTLQPIICEQGVPVTENGRLAAKFVAADARRMAITSSTGLFNALHTTGGTVLLVGKNNDTALDQTILANKSSDVAAGIRVFANSSDESFGHRFGRQDVAGVATDGYTITGTFVSSGSNAQRITAMLFDPDATLADDRAFSWVNGTQRLTNNAQTAVPFVENSQGNMTLGASSAGATPMDGTISEVAAFSDLISNADRIKYEANASRHYGISITESLVSISAHPSSVTTTIDYPYTMTVVASNATAYQWQYSTDGGTTWLPGDSNTDSITVTTTPAMNGWQWRCVVMNPFGGVISNSATVTVEPLALEGLSIVSSLGGAWSTSRRVLPSYSRTSEVILIRRDSDNATLPVPGDGLLSEIDPNEVRTFNGWNLFARTAEFDHTYWTKSGATIANDVATAPDGTSSADRLTETLDNAFHRVQRTLSFTVGAAYTFSVYVKKESSSRFLLLNGNTALGVRASLNLDTLQVVNINGSGAQVTDVGNGWYRFSITGTALLASSTLFITISNSGVTDLAYLGDGSSFLIWGAQLEQSASVSTYEPRTTTAAGSSFLVTKYDQTGQARHFTQATTTLQPIVCEQGVPVTEGGRLSAKYVAANARRLLVPSSAAMFNYMHTTGGTVLAVAKANDTAAYKTIIGNNSGNSVSGFVVSAGSSETISFGIGRINSGGSPANGWSAWDFVGSLPLLNNSVIATHIDPDNTTVSNRLKAWINGVLDSGISAGSNGDPFLTEDPIFDLRIGITNVTIEAFDGTISEAVIASDLISDSDRDAWESRTGSFFGVSVS